MRIIALLLPLLFATICYGSLVGRIRSGLRSLNPFARRTEPKIIEPIPDQGYNRPPRPKPVIGGMVVFGDSHSDSGNTLMLSKNRSPPSHYFAGRYSNGPNWVDNVGKNMRIVIKNFAYGGGSSDSKFNPGKAGFGSTVEVPGIAQQIGQFLQSKPGDMQNTLFLLCGGGTDYYFNTTVEALDVKNAMRNNAEALLKKGAVSVGLCTIPPMSTVPLLRRSIIKRFIAKLAEPVYNNAIKQLVYELQTRYPDRYILTWDLESVIRNILKNSAALGFKNISEACADETNNQPACKNPDEYVYWDSVHPSAHTHRLIAQDFQQLLSNNFIYRPPYVNNQQLGNVPPNYPNYPPNM
ncbi:hypothetical protein K7432_012496 [Basidiobolus ranarum]|uniref:Uncharacterized protein n=1 Tax=Basidiobolus ranarum TaxID=34480 RepID=A0ABR2VT28_9FUNG